jgi:hypothetical protein
MTFVWDRNYVRSAAPARIGVLGAGFRSVRKIAKSVISVRPSVRRLENLGSHWTNFRETFYAKILQNSVEKISFI